MALSPDVVRRLLALWPALALVGANLVLGLLLARSPGRGSLLALLPAIVVGVLWLVESNRAVLVFGAFAINLLVPLPLTDPLPAGFAGITLYPSDVIVLLAVGSWLVSRLSRRTPAEPRPLQMTALGVPLLLLAATLSVAVVRGHVRYGVPLVGPPARLLLYAGAAVALADVPVRQLYRGLVIVFYAGTLWQTVFAVYGYASGTSVTNQVILSTGGERVLAGSTAIFMASALLLALLNLERTTSAGHSAFHLGIAVLAAFALVSTFQRTTFALVSVLIPLALLAFRHVTLRAASVIPLFAPFVALAVLLVPRGDPTVLQTLAHRVTASPNSDATAQWRLHAYEAVWNQVRESPLTGVGFGRPARFVLNGNDYAVGQDPHNQFLYLWAGGGLLLLGSFALALVAYGIDAWRRFRTATAEERRLIFWAVSTCFVFLVNAATGIILTVPNLLLPFWILIALPGVVPTRERARPAPVPAWETGA
ncbi:MAG TPA: O-antigen ligase family protein [Gaiellaceae bacterium]